MPFATQLDVDGEVVVVSLRGELDFATCPLAEEELLRAEALRPGTLIVDLSNLGFMDSNGARFLIGAHDRAMAAGREMAVLNGSGPPHRVLELLELQDVLQMIDDPSELAGPRPGRAR